VFPTRDKLHVLLWFMYGLPIQVTSFCFCQLKQYCLQVQGRGGWTRWCAQSIKLWSWPEKAYQLICC